MKFLLHYLKTEYQLHSKVLWLTFLILLCLGFMFHDESAISLVTYCSYAGFLIGLTYKKDFSLKYFVGLPVSRDHLIIALIIGRSIYFIPSILVLSIFYSSLPKHEWLNLNYPLFVITFCIAVSIYNATQVLGDIESPRIESVPGRLDSFLMFFKKIVNNYIFGGLILILGFTILKMLITALGMNFLANQYLVVIYGATVLLLSVYRCHHVFINEELTYWSWKKDGVITGVFFALVIAPGIIFKQKTMRMVYSVGNSPYFAAVESSNTDEILNLHQQGYDPKIKNDLGYTPLLTAIRNGDLKIIQTFESLGVDISTDDLVTDYTAFGLGEIPGKLTPIHVAMLSNNSQILEYVSTKPGQIELLGHKEVTYSPLHTAAKLCYPDMVQPLLDLNVPIDRQNKGHTALSIAVLNDCPGVAVELLRHGARADIKDKSGKTVFDYKNGRQMRYFLRQFSSEKMTQNRLPASTNLANPQMKR